MRLPRRIVSVPLQVRRPRARGQAMRTASRRVLLSRAVRLGKRTSGCWSRAPFALCSQLIDGDGSSRSISATSVPLLQLTAASAKPSTELKRSLPSPPLMTSLPSGGGLATNSRTVQTGKLPDVTEQVVGEPATSGPMTSLPASPISVSSPPFPSRRSMPGPPRSVFFAKVPTRRSLPEPPVTFGMPLSTSPSIVTVPDNPPARLAVTAVVRAL